MQTGERRFAWSQDQDRIIGDNNLETSSEWLSGVIRIETTLKEWFQSPNVTYNWRKNKEWQRYEVGIDPKSYLIETDSQ